MRPRSSMILLGAFLLLFTARAVTGLWFIFIGLIMKQSAVGKLSGGAFEGGARGRSPSGTS